MGFFCLFVFPAKSGERYSLQDPCSTGNGKFVVVLVMQESEIVLGILGWETSKTAELRKGCEQNSQHSYKSEIL